MNRKLTWLAGALAAVLVLAPAPIAQTTWVVSDEDGDDAPNYAFFGVDDSAFLGVTMEEETDHEGGGARITSIVDDSPADKAGLREGDIVIGFGKDTIRGPVSLTKKIRDLEPGDVVEITLLRDGRKKTVEVELGNRSEHYSMRWSYVAPRVLEQLENLDVPEIEFDAEALQKQLEDLNLERLEGLRNLQGYALFDNDEWRERIQDLSKGFAYSCEDGDCDYSSLFWAPGRARLGVQLTETTPELREHLGGGKDAGVLVSKVVKGSAAEAAGVEVGDLIVDVDGETVGSTGDLRKALAEREGETFDIQVIRGGRSTRLSVTLETEEGERPTGPRASRRLPDGIAPAIVVPPAPAPVAVPATPAVRAAPLAPRRPALEADPVPAPAPLPDLPAAPRPAAPVLAGDVI